MQVIIIRVERQPGENDLITNIVVLSCKGNY